MAEVDLYQSRRFHVVGIAGAGMSAIAEVLATMGHRVTGTDIAEFPVLGRLRQLGVEVQVGFDAANVDGADVVTVSTAWLHGNPEVEAARAAGIPVLRRAEMLAAIAQLRQTIAVAGTHGKTTTSAMLATILATNERRPSFVVGGELLGLGTGARWDEGHWFVVEADESDGTFLDLPAEVAVVTSVEPDHLEFWGGFGALVDAFDRFLTAARIPIICGDDPCAAELAARHGFPTYGFDEPNAVRLSNYEGRRDGCRFTVAFAQGPSVEVSLPVPGRHNARNATAALMAATVAGVAVPDAAAALASYRGVARRAHVRGERDGVTYVDEYAHLPGEVAVSLATAREGGWRRIVCVFQPHRYSRTEALWPTFAGAFSGADLLVVTDVYPAGERARPGVSGKLVVDAVLDGAETAPPRVAWLPARADVVAFLRRVLQPGDLCLTLGAGDLTTLPDELLAG